MSAGSKEQKKSPGPFNEGPSFHEASPSNDASRAAYILHLADNALILGHRNSEWTGHGPILEQDIALSNISLDLIGQARNLYQYAAGLINARPMIKYIVLPGAERSGAVSEDSLAYLRDSLDYKNCLLVEQPNGDWGKTLLRQFFFSAYQFCLYEQLKDSRDPVLAAIAEKSIKEVVYHLRWSSEWVIRLGYGTVESHRRMQHAMDELWSFTGELFVPASFERDVLAEGIGADLSSCKPVWDAKVHEILDRATLLPDIGLAAGGVGHSGETDVLQKENGRQKKMQWGGKEGQHTEHLGYILAEMQFLQRAYPGCEW